MKQKLLLFLLALTGLLGSSVHVWAQDVPEPTVQWTFNDVSNLLAPSKGTLTMTPALLGTRSITLSTLSEAGIETADGPDGENKAIFVPAASALKVERAAGATESRSYTIMLDVMVLDSNPYDGLLQTDPGNGSDGDLFIHTGQVGVASLGAGGYFGKIRNEEWNRIVLTYRDGKNILYQNGEKLRTADPDNNDRFMLQPFGFYLFCDEDGEKQDTYVAEVAFWETALSDEEISALGGYTHPVENFEIGNAGELVAFAQYIAGGKEANAVLTADIELSGKWETPIGIEGAPFSGIFDGQGHQITGFQGSSDAGKFGLFGNINNATVKNFSLDGVLEVTGSTGSGAIGWSASSRISNVHSTLDISIPVDATAGTVHHVGGVVGSAQYNNRITGCTFAGSLSEEAGNNDCFGGVVGYMAADTILYCANYGTVIYTVANGSVGGIAGYLNNESGMMRGCLNMGTVAMNDPDGVPTYGGAFIGWLRGNTQSNMMGNYWLEGSAPHANGQGAMPAAVSFTPDKLATGEVCYGLNGDQSEIGWYQTIGTDETPVYDPSHGQVYMSGRKHCDGSNYQENTYSNTSSTITQDDHDFVDGYCTYCDLYDDSFTMTPNADGYYEISSVNLLRRFAGIVNSGTLNAKAVLVDDIDFADIIAKTEARGKTFAWTPIGSWVSTPSGSACFQGHFDGQGHVIKNFNVNSNQSFFALFGVISTDCLIENFDIDGTINNNTQYSGGVAAYSRDDRPVIRNIHSSVNINNVSAGGRQGGILGGAHSTTFKTVIENCTYSGTLDGNDAGGSGNYGGIIGYVNNNGNTVVDITNCLFDGEVVNTNQTPGNCTFGGIVGYSNGGVVTVKNCLSIGKVESPIYGQFFGAVKSNKSSLPNSYYQGDEINGSASTVELLATEVSDYELESGEIAWKLNEEQFVDVVWHQVLENQTYPVPFGNDGIVYDFDQDYRNITEESLADLISDVISREKEFIDDLAAYQPLLGEYENVIESWQNITTLEAFFEAYRQSIELKESIKTSAANYEAYVKACQDAAQYIVDNNLDGVMTDFLKDYLEKDLAPDANYPNGSYTYIMDNLNLDDEGLAAEMAFLSQMLDRAIAGGIAAGTEITRLLTNPQFTEGYEGWTVETDGGTATVGGTPEIMSIPEGFNNKTFSATQTLNELPSGIYMMSANGLFRTGNDIYNQFYAGQLFLNETYNYFMSPGEDVVLDENAEFGVNCSGEPNDRRYETDDVIGWVPQLREGCSVVFTANRYQNFVATEVTDGTLTIGVRNLGTGMANDWLPFGNLHIYYLGTEAEAANTLDQVLGGFKNRAQVIVDYDYSTEDFVQYPNMSEELKGELTAAISQVNQTTDKMQLINTFSDLFNQVHASRMAYIALYVATNKLYDTLDALDLAGLISNEEYEKWEKEVMEAQGHYISGDVTTEEALAIADKLNNSDLLLKPVDGVYQLETAADLAIFAMIVNAGAPDANAVVTNDIDLAELSEDFSWTPIGNWGVVNGANMGYRGHFDGQGHTIKNFNYIAGQNWFGFFGVLSTDAIIENFNIEGEIITGYQYAGSAAGYGRDNNVTIRGIHSYVNIMSEYTGGRTGGILGCADNGTIRVEECTYSGILDGYDAGGGGNYGGIVGYTNNSTNAVCTINNCLFDGELINTVDVPGNCTFGGMVGYTNSSLVTISNCLSIGKVQSARYAQFFGALNGNNSKIINSYYKGDYINGSGSGGTATPLEATRVTTSQLASGEICFKLNNEQPALVWYQTLFEDNYPVLDKSREVILYSDEYGYYNDSDNGPVGISEVQRTETKTGVMIYNLAGQRLEKLQKGINIVNGKKILVK